MKVTKYFALLCDCVLIGPHTSECMIFNNSVLRWLVLGNGVRHVTRPLECDEPCTVLNAVNRNACGMYGLMVPVEMSQ